MNVNAKRDNSRFKEIEIMDCTLRDGEQTNGVSFLPHEKLMIARMLLHDINVDRIEVASARVSEGEKDAVARICRYAKTIGKLDSVEVLGFVDNNKSVDWIAECGGHVINLLAKGSYKHCTQQLKMSPEEHLAHIKLTIDYALSKGFTVNLYLEDWSSGMRDSRDYLFMMMDELVKLPIKRFLLPDTLGILNPLQCVEYMRQMVRRYPNSHFDYGRTRTEVLACYEDDATVRRVMSSTSWRRVAISTAPSSSRCRLRSISLISSRLSIML